MREPEWKRGANETELRAVASLDEQIATYERWAKEARKQRRHVIANCWRRAQKEADHEPSR